MCATCGCGPTDHHHSHDHGHSLGLEQNTGKKIISVEQDILQENNLLAQRNRGFFEGRNILSLNLVSSPGSGKTTLLERTLTDLKGQLEFAVIEGDQQTANDADRIHATGTKVTQINTGKGCHLDAHMILHAVQGMKLKPDSVLSVSYTHLTLPTN